MAGRIGDRLPVMGPSLRCRGNLDPDVGALEVASQHCEDPAPAPERGGGATTPLPAKPLTGCLDRIGTTPTSGGQPTAQTALVENGRRGDVMACLPGFINQKRTMCWKG